MPFSRAVLALFTLMSALVPTQASAQARHPLDALTADEIIRTVAIIRASGRLGAEARFATIDLAEPPKQQDTTPFSEDMRTYRTIVAPGVTGPIHQHFFSYRLDFDVDGTSNTVVEAQIESDPVGPANPEGHWFAARERVLATESKARRNVSTPTARTWRVVNEGHSNALGRPTAYALVPRGNVAPAPATMAASRRKIGFVDWHLWVTPFVASEMGLSGFPNAETLNLTMSYVDVGLIGHRVQTRKGPV